jgi:hypothetical protein
VRRSSRRCGHIDLKDVLIAEDEDGVYKRGTCSCCGSIVVVRYSMLKQIVTEPVRNKSR